MPFHHKNIRLPHQDYLGPRWYFITICCPNRRKRLTAPKICDDFLNILRSNAATHSFAIHAYCLMPDHVHLLAEGLQPQSDLVQFMRAIKMKTSMPFERKTEAKLFGRRNSTTTFFATTTRRTQSLGTSGRTRFARIYANVPRNIRSRVPSPRRGRKRTNRLRSGFPLGANPRVHCSGR